jgi:hypothetical protein
MADCFLNALQLHKPKPQQQGIGQKLASLAEEAAAKRAQLRPVANTPPPSELRFDHT